MLVNVNGKVDGVHRGPYHRGEECDIDDDVAELFIDSAMAERIVTDVVDEHGGIEECPE